MCKQFENEFVTISYSNHITENYKSAKITLLKMVDLLKSKFNYSAGLFENGYRNKNNYKSYCDVLILDIDDGLSINEARKIFEPYDYIIATTKSHMKNKNGIVCERFRIVIPLENPMELSESDYYKTMEEIYKKYPFVDKACKDGSRFYYPYKDSEIITHAGFCGFYWEDFYKKTIVPKNIDDRLSKFKNNFEGYKKQEVKYEYGLQKVDYIRSVFGTEKLLELLKFKDKFVSGQRNTTLYSYAKYFQDIGLGDSEIKEYTLWVNSCGDSVDEKEIEKTIFRSLKI